MRILFATEQFPYPLHDGGNLRTHHVLAGLAQEHDVHLVAHTPVAAGAVEALSEICAVTTVPEPPPWNRLLRSSVRPSTARQALFIQRNWSPPLLDAMRRLLTAQSFDAIHFNHLDTACYALQEDWPQIKFLDTHNCLHQMAAQASACEERWWLRKLLGREARLLAQSEGEICRRMDACFVCSEEDRATLQKLVPQGEFLVAPNGVDREFFSEARGKGDPGSLVFVGAMDYFPNVRGASFFCRDVLPHLDDLPDLHVHLVGRNPNAEVRALASSRVTVTGSVDDVRPFMAQAQVVVVPLLHGGGTRLKILEAFAAGKPVVSTAKGAEGIAAEAGKEICIADSATEFAQAIRRLLSSAQQRQSLAQAAEAVARRYDWSAIQQGILQVYRTKAVATPERSLSL